MSRELFEVEVSADRMEASIALTRAGMEAIGVQPADLLRALKEAGVTFGIHPGTVEKAARGFRSADRDMLPVPVAFGAEPIPGDPGDFESVVAYGHLAHGDRVVARLGPGRPATPGTDVLGESVPGQVADVRIKAGDHIRFESGERAWVADIPGYLYLREGTLHLTPLFVVEEGDMSARAVFRGPVPTAEVLEELLREAGVVAGGLTSVIEEVAGREVPTDGPPLEVEVARGKPAIRGRNARIQFCVDIGRVSAGELRPDGTINYRKRQTFCLVDEGELLAIRVPATEGRPGFTVRGMDIPATAGLDRQLEPGQNVTTDDRKKYFASARGAAVQLEDRIDVHASLTVAGDIDYHVGNLDCPIGVRIEGDVRSAFEVNVKAEAEVVGTIEDAIIQVEKELTVGVGVLQGRVGSVSCGSDIRARFMENTRASAKGDIHVVDNLVNCSVVAGGSVSVIEGKGTIIGGHTAAVNRVEAKVFGSRMNVKTVVQVGVSFAALQPIEQRLRDIEREMAAIVIAAGAGFFRLLESDEEPSNPKLQQFLRRWGHLEKKRDDLEMKRSNIITRSAGEGAERAEVVVHDVAYPGTIFVFGARRSLLLKYEKPAGRFFWDSERHQVCFIPQAD